MKCWALCSLGMAVLAGASMSSAAQQPAKVFHIGILSPAAASSTKAFDAFRGGLRELGYIEGSNVEIEYRLAAWGYDRLPALAADLVRLPVDVIVTDSPRATQIAQQATDAIPIVAATIGADPVAAGLAMSLAHPGANLTGFSGAGTELSGKRVQLLKDTVPGVSRVAGLRTPSVGIFHLQATEEAARALGLDLRTVEVAAPEDILPGFEVAVGAGAEGLVVGHLRGPGICHWWRAAYLWARRFRAIPAGRGICRQDPKGRQARRSAHSAADEVPTGCQPEDRQSARADDPTADPRSRRRGH